MKLTIFPALLLASLLAPPLVTSHGDESPEALAKRDAFTARARRSLSACSAKLRERGLHAARIEKREDLVERRFGEAKRKHKKRQLTHGYDVSSLYSSDKEPGTCILAPEEVIGPYYLSTHLFREDIRSSPLQKGIEFLLTVQLVDVNTCEPIQGVTAEFWHCNYMGVYSGFKTEGSLNEDFLRGMQTSDKHGIVQIVTNFPGWYPQRAVHVHIATHLNGTLVPSDQDVRSAKSGEGKFYTGGTVPHIGQLYFPESILSKLEKASPYSKHANVTRTKNNEDKIFNGSGKDVQIMDIRFIEEGKMEGGLVGDVIVGLDLTKNYTATASSPTATLPPIGANSTTATTTTGATGGGTYTGPTEKGEAGKLTFGQIPMAVAMGLGWLLGN